MKSKNKSDGLTTYQPGDHRGRGHGETPDWVFCGAFFRGTIFYIFWIYLVLFFLLVCGVDTFRVKTSCRGWFPDS